MKTTDAGTSWTSMLAGTLDYFTSVCFTSAGTGYAFGGSGAILKTTNGGNNWTPLYNAGKWINDGKKSPEKNQKNF